jgi:PelA/Pel-15E family pectate lyase
MSLHGLKRMQLFAACLLSLAAVTVHGADRDQALATMKRATVFMVDHVSHEGGYVWNYLPDFSRRWGEMEAYPTMIWIQPPGTPGMGSVFLDAYRATRDEYYYKAATRAADALIRVQHPAGGWNYVADLAGEESLRRWYDTIGRNGWRLEEFQHYYGNATFDDGTTTSAARFMMQLYLEKRDAKYGASLDRSIQFVLDAQYHSGGWPQRFPLMGGFSKDGHPDYTGFITFNDDVALGNLDFLIDCHQVLGEERLLDPLRRAMNCFVVTQQKSPQAGWAMQYTPDLEPAGARTYEPKALVTHTTVQNIAQLIRFYRLTGDTNFLTRIPEALAWLDSVKWGADQANVEGTHPTFVELGSNKPLFLHRKGSNARNGKYYTDDRPEMTIAHYSSSRKLAVEKLRDQYQAALATPPNPADLLLNPRDGATKRPRSARARDRDIDGESGLSLEEQVNRAINSLNKEGYWPSHLGFMSHPYRADEPLEKADDNYSTMYVGDKGDTSPYRIPETIPCISVSTYIRQMRTLIDYIEPAR